MDPYRLTAEAATAQDDSGWSQQGVHNDNGDNATTVTATMRVEGDCSRDVVDN